MSTWYAAIALCGLLLPTIGCAYHGATSDDYVKFGFLVASYRLWNEATFRFEQAVKVDPKNAAAWNNLGLAYEQLQQDEKALAAYDCALALEPDNVWILQNYDYLRERLAARKLPDRSADTDNDCHATQD